jgi:hypothetical protein
MSIFGGDDRYSDAALIRAARKRLLGELSAHKAASSSNTINNNISSGGGHDVGGLMGLLGSGGGQEPGAGGSDPFDYLVDIERKDLDINPDTGKPHGWTKAVRRHRTPKDEKKK